MKIKKVFIVILIVLFFGCKKNENEKTNNRQQLYEAYKNNTDTSISESSKYMYENLKIEFDMPVAFKSTENVAIPIILEEKYVDKISTSYSYFNIAIVDTSNTLKKLLFNESVIIEDIITLEERIDFEDYYYNDEDKKKYSKEYNSLIFLKVWKYRNRKKDYKRFFVYDLEKDTLKQLSPENCHVTSVNIFNNIPKILIRYKFDSNNDGKFDIKDDENMTIVNPLSVDKPNHLFDIHKLKEIKLNVADEN